MMLLVIITNLLEIINLGNVWFTRVMSGVKCRGVKCRTLPSSIPCHSTQLNKCDCAGCHLYS